MRTPRRAGIWLLAVIALVASAAFFGTRLLIPSDGALIGFYAGAWTDEGVRIQVSAQPPSGLRDDDLVVGVGGRSFDGWLSVAWDPTVDRPSLTDRELTYSVQRDSAELEVSVTLAQADLAPVLAANWSMILFIVVMQAVAAYVLWRRPAASAAVALMVAASAVTGSALPWLLGLQVSDVVTGWPFLLHAFATGGLYMLLWPAGAIHLPLALAHREGRPTRRLLAAAYALPLGGYLACLLLAAVLAPTVTAWVGMWPFAQLLVIVPTLLTGVAITVRAYIVADPRRRSQIRWAAVGASAAGLMFLALFVGPELVLGRPLVPWSLLGLFALPLPVGIAAGVVRHGLLDIEVVVNRALVYGGLTVAVLTTYVVVVSLLGTALGTGEAFGISLLATGAAALVALPVRDVLQRSVNRLMYGDRDDPYRALVRLGQRLEATLDPLEGPAVVLRTVADSLRVPWVGLRLGADREGGRLFEHGRRPAGDVLDVPLLFGAEAVGHLLVAPRSPSEPLSAADRQLLDALARQAGAAIHALSLTFELVDSRQRIVAAREEERRRIRRDLHDGLGPTLAAIGMRAEAAAEIARQQPEVAAAMLAELRTDAHGALAEVRRLVDALRPPALDELGLVGAIEQQAYRLDGTLRTDVRATDLPDLPAAVEVAAYRIAAEAMTNALRHSGASSCEVSLAVEDDGRSRTLVVSISDDGRGLPADIVPGVGLRSMRDRAAEIGGAWAIDSNSPRGTRVTARLPIDEIPHP